MKNKKIFLGQEFIYETQINKKGKVLWTHEIDNLFSKWLYQLKEENRDLFKVQYSISKNANSLLEKMKEQVGVTDESLIVRAATITFINFIDTSRGSKIMKKLNRYKDLIDVKALKEGERVKKNLYFSPLGMRDVENYSQLTELSRSKVILNSLYSVLLISINKDEEIKKFWEDEVLPKIILIIKAA